MDKYSKIVKMWERLHIGYAYEIMPFFCVIMEEFYEDLNKRYITAEEMKSLIVHYKNVLNLYKNELRNKEFSVFPGLKPCFLRKRIQREYNHVLRSYDNLLNIEDMTNGRYEEFKRKTMKINR